MTKVKKNFLKNSERLKLNQKIIPISIISRTVLPNIYLYYLELYPNMSIARENPNGLVAFAILVQITESLYRKSDFDFISVHLDKVR